MHLEKYQISSGHLYSLEDGVIIETPNVSSIEGGSRGILNCQVREIRRNFRV